MKLTIEDLKDQAAINDAEYLERVKLATEVRKLQERRKIQALIVDQDSDADEAMETLGYALVR